MRDGPCAGENQAAGSGKQCPRLYTIRHAIARIDLGELPGSNRQRERYCFASGFQFCSSVIGVAASSDDNETVLSRAKAALSARCVVLGTATRRPCGARSGRGAHTGRHRPLISMPGMNGFELARRLRAAGSTARLVFLTVHDEEELILAAGNAGAIGDRCRSRASGGSRGGGVRGTEPEDRSNHDSTPRTRRRQRSRDRMAESLSEPSGFRCGCLRSGQRRSTGATRSEAASQDVRSNGLCEIDSPPSEPSM